MSARDIQVVEEILREFNFGLVARAMKAVKWKYYFWDGEDFQAIEPTVERLRKRAAYLLEKLIAERIDRIEMGGFEAYRYFGEDGESKIGLKFVFECFDQEMCECEDSASRSLPESSAAP